MGEWQRSLEERREVILRGKECDKERAIKVIKERDKGGRTEESDKGEI